LAAAWRALSPAEKLERIFGLSLDQIAEILSWPADELDMHRLAVQVTHVMVVAAARLLGRPNDDAERRYLSGIFAGPTRRRCARVTASRT
jgi:hypothetical protein